MQKAQDSKYSKEEKRNKSRLAKLQGLRDFFKKIFLNIFYSGGSQERLNEFLESREKMKQILDTQLQQKRKEMLQKFESERLKLLTGKLKKKQDEGKTSQRINILINLFLFEWTIIFCRSKAHDKKPSRQEEQYVQRSDYKKYR